MDRNVKIVLESKLILFSNTTLEINRLKLTKLHIFQSLEDHENTTSADKIQLPEQKVLTSAMFIFSEDLNRHNLVHVEFRVCVLLSCVLVLSPVVNLRQLCLDCAT